MTLFKRPGDKAKYSFSDAKCIGRECWAPGMYQHRSPLSGGGSRNTGSPDSPCCLNRAYRGCPQGPVGEREEPCFTCLGQGHVLLPDFTGDGPQFVTCAVCAGRRKVTIQGLPAVDIELTKQRKSEGWRLT